MRTSQAERETTRILHTRVQPHTRPRASLNPYKSICATCSSRSRMFPHIRMKPTRMLAVRPRILFSDRSIAHNMQLATKTQLSISQLAWETISRQMSLCYERLLPVDVRQSLPQVILIVVAWCVFEVRDVNPQSPSADNEHEDQCIRLKNGPSKNTYPANN